MPKFQETVKVLGKTFHIKEVDGLVDSGSTDTTRQIILINKNLCPEQRESTIIHELIEVFNSMFDTNLSHQTICSLETFIHGIYKDNF